MLSMQSNMEIGESSRWTATESSESRPPVNMSSNEVLLEWLKKPGNYARFAKGGDPSYVSVDGRGETRSDMAREVLVMLEAAGYQGRNHIATAKKMINWVRRYKKAHELACSGANEHKVRKTFPYYYNLVDCIGNDSELPINIRESRQKRRGRQKKASSSSRDVSLDTYLEGSPLSSAASLSPSPGPDYLSSSSSAYSQTDYVPHMPIIRSRQPDSSTLCSFSEQNIINGPRRLPVPSIQPRGNPTVNDSNNNNNSNNDSNNTTHHHCQATMQRMMETLYQQQEYHNQQMSRLLQQNQELLTQQAKSHRIHEMQVQASLMVSVIDRLSAAGLSKNEISAHLLQLNGGSNEEQQQQLIPQQDQ